MLTLIQFTLRLSFGMAASMLLVSPRQVTSGYFRNNAYVLLGLNVLAALALSAATDDTTALWLAVAAGAVSYLGSAAWLYESVRFGMLSLAAVAALDLAATWFAQSPHASDSAATILWRLDPLTSGLLLGVTMAAMLLGHWYLNSPGMALAPLNRLLALLAIACVLRAAIGAVGLTLALSGSEDLDVSTWLFLSLRWVGGLLGTALLCVMAWRTLKIPNTQSATGILYVAVITTFLGELVSGLLSAESVYPL